VRHAVPLVLGLTIDDLAKKLDRNRSYLSAVIHGRDGHDSAPIRRKIAGMLGVDVMDIWPPESGVPGDAVASLHDAPTSGQLDNAGNF